MIPFLDYEDHPVFGQYIVPGGSDDAFENIHAAIDTAIDAGTDEITQVKSDINALVADLPDLLDGFRPYLRASLECTIERRQNEEGRRKQTLASISAMDAHLHERTSQLHEQGFTKFRLHADKLAELQHLISKDVDMLRARVEETTDAINFADPSNPGAATLIQDFCQQEGVFDTLSALYGEPMHRVGFIIHLSTPTDKWFHVFDDIGMPPSQTIQMHLDLEYSHPKAMLYLNDIGPDNGPFSLIPKNEPWAHFDSATAFRKEILRQISTYIIDQGDEIAHNGSPFRYKAARAIFAALPPSLRQTSHFGDHVVDGSALSNKLLDMETAIIGEAGEMPVFAGSHVPHRGGIIKSGERLALQIVFFQVYRRRNGPLLEH